VGAALALLLGIDEIVDLFRSSDDAERAAMAVEA